jgi:parvulin-like peptidyl-prolyl isomerase
MPEVAEAITDANEGEVVRPIQTKLGYHIIRIEKWFPVHLNESLREEVIDSLFQAWLRERGISFPH